MESKESVPKSKFQSGDKVSVRGIVGEIASSRYGILPDGSLGWIHDVWYKKSTGGLGNLGHVPASEITLIEPRDNSAD